MTHPNLLYEIAFTLIKGIGNITGREILNAVGDASVFFQEKKQLLKLIPKLPSSILSERENPEILKRAEKEIAFIEKNKIQSFFITDESYPYRLKECVDAPLLFFFKGNADLNAQKVISIVGTRNITSYGKETSQSLVTDIQASFPEALIVSGLAYGVDIAAHKAALNVQSPTVAVLAHGLDRIYPYDHRDIAKQMLVHGGLLTEFMSETNPDRHNFIKRNRIVAGLADCTIIVESAEKGGALITARIAGQYNRDVLAFPGKVSDRYSQGCNNLIKNTEAALICSASDVFREMGWMETPKRAPVQRTLLLDLSEEEQRIVDILNRDGETQLNVLSIRLDLPISSLAPVLFEMEMKGILRCAPGGVYQLL